jgi:hypothetical protein
VVVMGITFWEVLGVGVWFGRAITRTELGFSTLQTDLLS